MAQVQGPVDVELLALRWNAVCSAVWSASVIDDTEDDAPTGYEPATSQRLAKSSKHQSINRAHAFTHRQDPQGRPPSHPGHKHDQHIVPPMPPCTSITRYEPAP